MQKHCSYIRRLLGKRRGTALLLASSLLSSLLVGCLYESESTIPPYPVYYQVDFSSSIGKALISPGGYLRVEHTEVAHSAIGYGGLLIIHSLQGNNTFYAYDLSCPYERKREVKIFFNDRYEGECPQCKSRFSIQYGDGSPLSEPARTPLRRYSVHPSPQGLTVRN